MLGPLLAISKLCSPVVGALQPVPQAFSVMAICVVSAAELPPMTDMVPTAATAGTATIEPYSAQRGIRREPAVPASADGRARAASRSARAASSAARRAAARSARLAGTAADPAPSAVPASAAAWARPAARTPCTNSVIVGTR